MQFLRTSLFIILSLIFLSACQKNTFDLANAKEDPSKTPKYTLELDVNKSPAK